MSEQTAAPEATPAAPAPTGPVPMEDRIAAAAEALADDMMEAKAAPEATKAEPQADAAETEAKPEDKPAEAARPRRGRPPKADAKPQEARAVATDGEHPADGAEPEAEADKPRNMMKDLAAEWATARRAQKLNAQKAQELEAKAAQVEQQVAEARQIVQLMQADPIAAAEMLAKAANLRPGQYLERLQRAYLNGDGERERESAPATDAIARELAELRAELQREKTQRAQEEQARAYQTQVAELKQQETSTMLQLAKHYGSQFENLSRIPEKALERRFNEAISWYLDQGATVGRFEVMQAVDNLIKRDLDDLGLADMIKGRDSSTPAAHAGNGGAGNGQPRSRNGSASRNIPSNRDAANNGGVRRALTVEERLREAERLLTRASQD